MKTVWITGAGGLIGSYLMRHVREHTPEWQARGWTRPELDLTNFREVEKKFQSERPDLIIHCAAMSKSQDCQAQPALARRINVEATARLAALSDEGAFIFFSTDLVFDGQKGRYVETDAVNPLSIYAETKVAAETAVLRNPRHAVVRTSLNSGATPRGGTAYNEQLLATWRAGRGAKLFIDEYRCPIAAAVTARAVWELAMTAQTGLFHLAGGERLSRLQIGQMLAARHPDVPARIEPATLRDYAGAPRPPDTSLDCAKAQSVLSFELPGLTEWLKTNPGGEF